MNNNSNDNSNNTSLRIMKEYLDPLMGLIWLTFNKMNEINDLDIYDQIDAYMRTSEARSGMDKGYPKYLNAGWKQVYNSVDMTGIKPGEKSDGIMLHWLADVYTFWQWRYNRVSKDISEKCDARMLSKLYYPLHEASLQNACGKLDDRFFGKEKEAQYEQD